MSSESRNIISEIDNHYKKVIEDIRNSGRNKLRFGVYSIYDSTFGASGLIELMKSKKEWEFKIVVIPDIVRGLEHANSTYIKTRETFIKKYGKQAVLDGYNMDNGMAYDHLDMFDVVYYSNPYDDMVCEMHSIKYAYTKNVLPIYISYGYDVSRHFTYERLKSPELNLVWKCFTDTVFSLEDYKKYQTRGGGNVVLAGYSKMDGLYGLESVKNKRKKILIAPHHTVKSPALPLSNFLKLYDYILELPKMFPEADFVFRPHPMLFSTLINSGEWSEKRVREYIEEIEAAGIKYSFEGDYLHLFAECDALIHDCGSFTIEWLFTGKPACFVVNENLCEEHITTLMTNALSQQILVKTKEEINEFIKIIISDDYDKSDGMSEWVKENIAINYPHVSEFILEEIDVLKKP